MNSRKHAPKGFTVVELIMATAVFSVVLLLGLTGFVQVGRMFYKGITISQTRDVSTNILQTLSSDIKLAGAIEPVTDVTGLNAICVGNHRYTYNGITSPPLDSSNPSSFALKRDTYVNESECQKSGATPVSTQGSNSEMMQNNMRVAKFIVSKIGTTDLYRVNYKVIYGQDDDLINPTDADKVQCKNSRVSSQFCSVSEISTVIYRGLGQ